MSTDRAHGVSCASPDGLRLNLFRDNSISWDRNSLVPSMANVNPITVDISIMLFSSAGEWVNFINVDSNKPNNGEYVISRDVSSGLFLNLCNDGKVCPVVIGVQINTISEFPTLERLADQGIKISLWSGVYYYHFRSDQFSALCDEWSSRQIGVKDLLDTTLPDCPKRMTQAETPNSGFAKQQLSSLLDTTSYFSQWIEFFHPGVVMCYIQTRWALRIVIIIVIITDYSVFLQFWRGFTATVLL